MSKIGCQIATLIERLKRDSGPFPSIIDEFSFGVINGRHGRRQLLFGDQLAAAQAAKSPTKKAFGGTDEHSR